MKTSTSLTLIAVGAIVAFAITDHLTFLNLQVTGWILILTGLAGAIITRNSWLRRTLVAKNRPGTLTASSTRQRPPPASRRARQAARSGPRHHPGRARGHQGIRRRLTSRPHLQGQTPGN